MAGDQGVRRHRYARLRQWSRPVGLCCWLLTTVSLSGCNERAGAAPEAPASAAPTPEASASATPVGTATPLGTATLEDTPPPLSGPALEVPKGAKGCGELSCLEFPDARAAFNHVLSRAPRVLAVGEAHAQKGSEGVQSGAARFKDQLLPSLEGKASDLLLELWFPNPKCRKETVAKVRKQQQVVTKKQASTNKNEYVELGNAAKALGVTPRSLHPSCEELEAITKAGSGDIGLMLETVAKNTQEDVEALLERQDEAKQPKLIVAYGGALHNDPYPKLGTETWSFGAKLKRNTRYLALDVIVPEYIKESPAWQGMPWFSSYAKLSKARRGHGALLFEPRPDELVLIFPRAETKSDTAGSPSD